MSQLLNAATVKVFHILVVDDDDVIRESLVQYLTQYLDVDFKVTVDACPDTPEAKQCLSEKAYDLVISDINLPTDSGITLLNHVQTHYPEIKTALITAYKVEDFIRNAKQTGIYNIIAKTAPFNFEELATVVTNLLNPASAFGLQNYMLQNYIDEQHITEFVVTNSNQIMDAFFQLREFFTTHQVRSLDDLSTAMIEAITNAVYHVAKLPDGSLKYQKGQQIEALEPEEYVHIHYAYDSEKIGVSILDQGGRMTADEILYWLDRNISGSNLMDTHGRGIFLIHTLVDRLIINIDPGKKTEILVLSYFNQDYSSNKPLYINLV